MPDMHTASSARTMNVKRRAADAKLSTKEQSSSSARRTIKKAKPATEARLEKERKEKKAKREKKEETWVPPRCHVEGCTETNNRALRVDDTGMKTCLKHLDEPHCSKAGCRVRDVNNLTKVFDAENDPTSDEEPEDEYRCNAHPVTDNDSDSDSDDDDEDERAPTESTSPEL